jgi:deoxyribonuclease IV
VPRRPAVLIGSHVPVAGGLTKAIAYAADIGAETFQIFAGNPRGWALSYGDPAGDRAFRRHCERAGLPVYVHTPYLVNVGSPTAQTYERSIASIRHNLARAKAIGAKGVVVHTGSCVDDGGRDVALKQVREGLLPLLDELGDKAPLLLLEPTAGQGRSLCAGLDDLPPYLDALDWHPKVAVCLDTCHVFAAGARLDVRGGMTRMLNRLVDLVGERRLKLVHGNDATDPRGSFRDHHERIGRGHIGQPAFAALVRHPAMRGVPVILETPGGKDAYAEDLELLKGLRR